MFGWIPIIGPIIDGVVSIFSKYQDTELGKYTVDGKVDVAAMQASNDLAIATTTDIGVRLVRDIIMFPVAVWTAIISWDSIVVYEYPEWFFKVAPYPPSLAYLPYAIITFLFGATAMILWRR
jgi:hypothetical protein